MDEFSGAAINWASVRPRVGISACLLGQPVRYDGGHKRGEGWVEALGEHLTWVSVCPEVELGLGVPREPIRIERENSRERLRAVESRSDLTDEMRALASSRVAELCEAQPLCGFIVKSKSPSCALASATVMEGGKELPELVDGLFTRELRRQLPDLPIVEETVLLTSIGRDCFLGEVRDRYRNLAGVSR